MKIILRSVLFSISLLLSHVLVAGEYKNQQIERLLASDEIPGGVVFELLSSDKNTWNWAAPMLDDFRHRLLKKFPQLDIAIVSHGKEQFQLTKDKALNHPGAISTLHKLSESGVDIHVCGTHSSWKDVAEDSYIDFVNVSPSGPAQINNYVDLGYKRIILNKP